MVARINELCKGRKMTICALEKTLGLANNTIRKWDTNRPSVDRVAAVADYFGVTIESLLRGA